MAHSDQCGQVSHMDFVYNFPLATHRLAAEARIPCLRAALEVLCKKFVFSLERGEEQGHLHFQGLVHLTNKTRPKTLGVRLTQLFPGISFRATHDIKALEKYVVKPQTHVAGPFYYPDVYLGDDLPTQLLPWQNDLVTYIKGPVHDREIVWVYDKAGGCGKSTFARYLVYHKLATLITFCNVRDAMYQVQESEVKTAFLLDLPRTKPPGVSWTDVFSTIESLKNGFINNTKYQSKLSMIKRPHVIVFANFNPDAKQRKLLSEDRWRLFAISGAINRPAAIPDGPAPFSFPSLTPASPPPAPPPPLRRQPRVVHPHPSDTRAVDAVSPDDMLFAPISPS